jgi:hypothetical protein
MSAQLLIRTRYHLGPSRSPLSVFPYLQPQPSTPPPPVHATVLPSTTWNQKAPHRLLSPPRNGSCRVANPSPFPSTKPSGSMLHSSPPAARLPVSRPYKKGANLISVPHRIIPRSQFCFFVPQLHCRRAQRTAAIHLRRRPHSTTAPPVLAHGEERCNTLSLFS